MFTAVLVGCASGPDDRPVTADYLSATIFVPACGRAACHSATTASHGYPFDTVASSNASLKQLVTTGGATGGNGRGHRDLLSTIGASSNAPHSLMPPDDPLPEADLELVRRWADLGYPGLP